MAQLSYRPARVFAMQLLYAMEINGSTVSEAVDSVLESISFDENVLVDAKPAKGKSKKEPEPAPVVKDAPKRKLQTLSPEQKKYGMDLVDLVLAHREELNEDIKASSDHWDIERMAKIDRIIARIAMVELLYRIDVPTKVAVSEAVQIAVKFSTDDSGSFINGLLCGFMEKHGIAINSNKKDA